MAQSLSKIYIHLVFHIKTFCSPIAPSDINRLHCYIGQLVNATGCKVVCVGGTDDHVHILFLLSKTESIAHVVEEVKRNSSRWLKKLDMYYEKFEWQGGYGAFLVSKSVVNKTIEYINNQKEHHRKRTFREEYLEFLKLYGVEYDERYLFTN